MQMNLNKSSKAQFLEALRYRVSIFKIPNFLIFNSSNLQSITSLDEALDGIKNTFGEQTLAIRSSAFDEDDERSSCAGKYASVLDVPSTDREAVKTAINVVIASYNRGSDSLSGDDIIIQEMVTNTIMSGVIFTHDLNTGAPYYVINYDDVSGLTNTVTSGDGEYANRTLYVHRGVCKSLRSHRFQRLIEAVRELESIIDSRFLDIEFALGDDLTPYLLQVRAITTKPNWNRSVSKRIDSALEGIRTFINERFQPVLGVCGGTTVLGQMPDWNPAEMIGRAPRSLSLSLYQKLITDHAWRIARDRMGYAVPLGQPLMVSLAGQPYIDTRLSFHSFLPSELPFGIKEKVVNHWVERLKNYPELHDKVEFDVAITTYSFDIDEKIKKLIEPALNIEEISIFKEAVRKQAQILLDVNSAGGINKALVLVEALNNKQLSRNRDEISIRRIADLYYMIDECIQEGTIPFAILARHGFIARTILLSLEKLSILSKEDIDQIQSSIRTVASELATDMRRLQIGELSRVEFMSKYGHLRPGTYDILSLRYDQIPSFGTGNIQTCDQQQELNKFKISRYQKKKIDSLLEREGFKGFDSESLLKYIEAAIIGREYSKFIFTRSISDMLELIADFGEAHGLSREEMSHVPIEDLLKIVNMSAEDVIEERLRSISEKESERHNLSVAIRLPQILFDEAGVFVVPFQVSQPNFITQKKITAECLYLNSIEVVSSLMGKIVLIENADPGFDWIFTQGIAGLITKYGGANSHMAIRCAEFGIPAAIGCGEQRFEVCIRANQILLDCAAGLINPLS
jgi:hypothetical protein